MARLVEISEDADAKNAQRASGGARLVPVDDAPAAVTAGRSLNSTLSALPRQLGLTARYALEGPAEALQVISEPIRQMVTDPVSRFFGGQSGRPLGQEATRLADAIGLPKPEGANERVIGDATRLMAGSVAGSGLVSGAGRLAGGVAQGLPKAAPEMLRARLVAADPALRQAGAITAPLLTASAGAGLASGASREAGGSEWGQAGAAALGALAGGAVPSVAGKVAQMGRGVLNAGMSTQEMDARISAALGRAGMEYDQVPERVRQGLRQELESALKTGQDLSGDAVRRLAEFKMVGVTPTRGMITQDPVQITRERNLAKMGANSMDGSLHSLAQLENTNNRTLIQGLNQAGADRGDPFRAGEQAIGAIQGRDQAWKQAVSGLYNQARAMPGGDVPLNRADVVNAVYDRLSRENKLHFLPEGISNMLDTISQGQIKRNGQTFHVPFTANTLDNLLTDIATAQRGTSDGNVKAALKLARDAIGDVGIRPLKAEMGSSQVVDQTTADALRAADGSAGQFMDALNQARTEAAKRFSWQESAKPIEAALGGGQPDRFVQKFVVNGSLADAKAIADNAPKAQIREAILAHLKADALSGKTDEVGNFSASAFNRSMQKIGDRKLSLFFTPEELGRLKMTGRVSALAQNQPAGSAVNNSNSGALLLGRGLDLLDKMPIAGPMLSPALRNIDIAMRSSRAMNLAPGLVKTNQMVPATSGLLGPSMYEIGLLSEHR